MLDRLLFVELQKNVLGKYAKELTKLPDYEQLLSVGCYKLVKHHRGSPSKVAKAAPMASGVVLSSWRRWRHASHSLRGGWAHLLPVSWPVGGGPGA